MGGRTGAGGMAVNYKPPGKHFLLGSPDYPCVFLGMDEMAQL